MRPAPIPHLDHIVLAGPSLADAVAWFADRTGVAAEAGGSHPGWGTTNALVDLGGGAYLEIIGPDPRQAEPDRPRPFGVDRLHEPRIVTWAVHRPDLDGTVDRVRHAGYEPGDPQAMSRAAANGAMLRWRLTDTSIGDPWFGVVPFLIDWGDTPHPTTRALPTIALRALTATHPEPDRVRTTLDALGTGLEVTVGPPGLTLVLATSEGRHVSI